MTNSNKQLSCGAVHLGMSEQNTEHPKHHCAMWLQGHRQHVLITEQKLDVGALLMEELLWKLHLKSRELQQVESTDNVVRSKETSMAAGLL